MNNDVRLNTKAESAFLKEKGSPFSPGMLAQYRHTGQGREGRRAQKPLRSKRVAISSYGSVSVFEDGRIAGRIVFGGVRGLVFLAPKEGLSQVAATIVGGA